ncbi:uncharacterized protein LOC143202667 [Rhynchophorus ferrugineus]|uniref:uncharacterized protein LOC143202667 n=1 Tax=Rhynchophorus ferrugineus TaxID=354439 RepID=UPI003FCDE8AE
MGAVRTDFNGTRAEEQQESTDPYLAPSDYYLLRYISRDLSEPIFTAYEDINQMVNSRIPSIDTPLFRDPIQAARSYGQMVQIPEVAIQPPESSTIIFHKKHCALRVSQLKINTAITPWLDNLPRPPIRPMVRLAFPNPERLGDSNLGLNNVVSKIFKTKLAYEGWRCYGIRPRLSDLLFSNCL